MNKQFLLILKLPFKLIKDFIVGFSSFVEEVFNDTMAQLAYEGLKELYDKFEAHGLKRCQNYVYSNNEKYCLRYHQTLDYYDVRSASLAIASIENQVQHVVLEFDRAFKSPRPMKWGELVRIKARGESVLEVLEALNSDFEHFMATDGAFENL